jgi:sulfonate transport system permease protein
VSTLGVSARRTPAWSVARGAIVPLAIVAAWSVVSAAGIVPAHLLPSPYQVVLAGIDLGGRGLLVEDAAISIQRVLTGFAAGSTAGLVLGAAVGRWRTGRILLSPLIAALRSAPAPRRRGGGRNARRPHAILGGPGHGGGAPRECGARVPPHRREQGRPR